MKHACLKETQRRIKMSFPLAGNHSEERLWTSRNDSERYFQMKTLRIYLITVMMVVLTFSSIAYAGVPPTADFLYNEIDLGTGWWQYDYTLFNTSPIGHVGIDLYDLTLYFDSSKAFNVLSMPSGWDWIDGAGFIEVFSMNPGAPPLGTDIAPASSLGGFGFEFDYQAGMLPFDATFVNPSDIDNPFIFSGTSAPANHAIPEPSTLLLLGSGIAGLAVRKKFKSS